MSDELEEKEVVSKKSGNNYGQEWSALLILTANGKYYSRVRVQNRQKYTACYDIPRDAETAGYQLLASMIEVSYA